MTTVFQDERDLILAFAGCSLDESPGSNWVEKAGGLPEYICEIARAIKRSGKSTSQAISIAVSRVKKWATGAGVDGKTQAKAAKAVAQWEKLRTKNKAKKSAKVAASHVLTHDVLVLTNGAYNVEIVRTAFEEKCRDARNKWRESHVAGTSNWAEVPYLYVREQWTTFLIVTGNDKTFKVSYAVDSSDNVTFGEPVEVRSEYVEVGTEDEPGETLSDADIEQMMAASRPKTPSVEILALTAPLSPLERVVRAYDRIR